MLRLFTTKLEVWFHITSWRYVLRHISSPCMTYWHCRLQTTSVSSCVGLSGNLSKSIFITGNFEFLHKHTAASFLWCKVHRIEGLQRTHICTQLSPFGLIRAVWEGKVGSWRADMFFSLDGQVWFWSHFAAPGAPSWLAWRLGRLFHPQIIHII